MKKISALLVVLAAFLAPTSFAQSIAHRWDMTTVNDIVGTANGILGAGAQLSGGILTPAGGAGNPGGGTGNGLNLPTSAVAGLNDAFSIEVWYTWDGTGEYQTVFAFSNGTNNDYLINVANRGNPNVGKQSSAFKTSGNEVFVLGNAFTPNALSQVVVTYDGNTTANFYVNGVFANSITNVNPNFDLSSFTQLGIAGNSPWPDSPLHGTVSDFRIYSGILGDSQVSALNALGADATNEQIISAVPEPSVIALLGGAAAMLLIRRRRS